MIHQPSSVPYSLVCLLLLPWPFREAAVFSRRNTHFRISGVLTCPHREVGTKWCFKAQLYEYDTLDKDLLAEHGVICTTENQIEYILDGYDDDDGIGDNFYELFTWFHHNCSLHGLIYLEIHNLSRVAVTETDVVRFLPYNVSVQGSRVDDWP